jgi:hypothetical protein
LNLSIRLDAIEAIRGKRICDTCRWKVRAAERKTNMQSIFRSRDAWKKKALARNRLIKNITRRYARLLLRFQGVSKENENLRRQCNELREALTHKQLPQVPPPELLTMIASVRLIVEARISFRSVPRVLATMDFRGWIPHFTSVINWFCRVGLAHLREVKAPSEPWIAIVDMTLDIAYKKALVVLRLPLAIFLKRAGAVTLEDVSCAAIQIMESWKGEDVCQALQGILKDEPMLKAIVKDSGGDLGKGVRLWKESEKRKDVFTISDLSHEVANALKADFKDRISFKMITKKLKSNATRIFQSRLACLAPPKLRPKGRFMGISRLGQWLEKIQKLLGGPGRVPEGSLEAELRRLFGGFGNLNYMTRQLTQRSLLLAGMMKILKTNGLNRESYQEAMKIVESLPKKSKSYKRISRWLTRHLHIQCRLGISQMPLPVSSDIIESLFGVFKTFIARNSKAEMNHLVLGIAAMCGPQNNHLIQNRLAQVSHSDFLKWKKVNISMTGKMQRMRIFAQLDLAGQNQKWDRLKSG